MKKNELFFAATVLAILLVPTIYFASAVLAAPLAETDSGTITTSGANMTSGLDYNVALRETGTSCTANSQCASSYCCSNICSASACPTTTTTTGGGGTTVGGAPSTTIVTPVPATTPTPTPTPAPSPAITPVPVTAVSIPITATEEIKEVIKGVEATVLGMTTVTPEKVEVKQTGVAQATITSAQVQTVADSALAAATSTEAKQALQEIKSQISSGAATGVTITAKLEVFEVKAKDTGKVAFVSKVELQFKPEKDSKDVKIIEAIPKSVAASIAEVVFVGISPKVLQADPIVQWEFAEVKQDETKDMSYIVKKKLDKLETATVATAKTVAPSAPTGQPKLPVEIPSAVYVIAVIAIVAVALWKLKIIKPPKGVSQKYRFQR